MERILNFREWPIFRPKYTPPSQLRRRELYGGEWKWKTKQTQTNMAE